MSQGNALKTLVRVVKNKIYTSYDNIRIIISNSFSLKGAKSINVNNSVKTSYFMILSKYRLVVKKRVFFKL